MHSLYGYKLNGDLTNDLGKSIVISQVPLEIKKGGTVYDGVPYEAPEHISNRFTCEDFFSKYSGITVSIRIPDLFAFEHVRILPNEKFPLPEGLHPAVWAIRGWSVAFMWNDYIVWIDPAFARLVGESDEFSEADQAFEEIVEEEQHNGIDDDDLLS